MFLLDALTIVTHVATQLSSKWLHPPVSVQSEMYLGTRIYDGVQAGRCWADFSENDWFEFLERDYGLSQPGLNWLDLFVRVKGYSLRMIAASLRQHLVGCFRGGGGILLITDPLYPRSLKNISKPPLVLCYLGRIDLLTMPKIAVIGSRKASYEALTGCLGAGAQLAFENYCVVSGGAIGCDIATHQGMISTNREALNACVVFAGGLHELYPRTNKSIFEIILRRGGLFISERLWYQWSIPRDFPIRNRIVSGMCESVVVMQAGLGSGAMITANEALDQGRDVFVMAHDPLDVRADGSLQLIDDGAQAFESIEELMQMLILEDCDEMIGGNDTSSCQGDINPDTVEGEQQIN